MFKEFDTEFDRKCLLSHRLADGVAVDALTLSGLGSFATFLTIVPYVHVVCDFLQGLDIA